MKLQIKRNHVTIQVTMTKFVVLKTKFDVFRLSKHILIINIWCFGTKFSMLLQIEKSELPSRIF